jgi:Uma2 family endonuclease
MNELPHPRRLVPATTRAAEGLPRRRWTVAEIDAMVAAGIIDHGERFELIGGDAVPMHLVSGRHELVKGELNRHLQLPTSNVVDAAVSTTLRLDETTFVEPDFTIFPEAVGFEDLRGHAVFLLIEVSDTSLRYDLGRKIGVYAAHGIPEVWVIDAETLVTHVHRKLGAEGYRERFQAKPDETVSAGLAEGGSMNLGALGLAPL